MYHPEGRVFIDEEGWRYEYFIADHLGNTNSVVSDINGDGCLNPSSDPTEVLQENHYYPFGLNMDGPWAAQYQKDDQGETVLDEEGNPVVDQTKLNRYQYNGKELTEDLGLNWYAYGVRYYDAAIARFIGVDPIADKFANQSPYQYGYNNPLRFIDPTGMSGQDIIDIEKTTGQITITEAEGDDIVRLVDQGNVQEQYTYGENGSFLAENKVESANDSKTQMVSFGDADKAQKFYELAAKSEVEFAKIDFDSPIVEEKSIVMIDQKYDQVNTNPVLINLVIFQGAEILKHSHTHPMGAYWPTGYDVFTQNLTPPVI